jgi:hypothetical protein
VAHLTDGTLRRMVDDPDDHTETEGRHYAGCPDCQARFASMSENARTVGTLLAVPELHVDVPAAFKRVTSAPAAQPRFGIRLPIVRPASRPMVFAFAAAIAAIALLVTGVAQDTNFFSPNSVTPVPVTVADLQSLSQLSAYGTMTWTQQPQAQVVTSAAEAQRISGLHVPAAGKLPAGVSTTVTYAATTKAVAVFTFSAAKATAEAAKTGKALPRMPAGMDGAQLTVSVGPAVAEIFGNLKAGSTTDPTQADLPQLIVAESSAPVASSSNVTVKQLEDYLLAQPGLSPQLAAAIRAIGDPSTTLPIPIPIQFATSSRVQVQGVTGVALGDNTGLGSAVVWVKNGVVYGVAGTLKLSDVLNVANQLK